MALDLMLQNAEASDPPITLTAQTNHALDQLLRHISRFEPTFIRLGGRTQDFEIVKPRTLYEVKGSAKPARVQGGLREGALANMKRLTLSMLEILGHLRENQDVHPSSLLKEFKIISASQCESLINGRKERVTSKQSDNEVAVWLGEEKIEPHRTEPEDFGFLDFEDAELDDEQLREAEAENKKGDEDEAETLKGTVVSLNEPWTGRPNIRIARTTIEREVAKKDLWKVPIEARGPVYRHFQGLLKAELRRRFRFHAADYANAVREAKIGRFEQDHHYLKDSRIIGVTTTGLSKYRALLQSVNPKIAMIEEAAETLEAFGKSACMPSIQHLILVGDHAQLRGSPSDQDLAGPPFYLDVSLLERMARNHVEFSQLNVQRRMIPEIRRILVSIYPDLKDHQSTKSRESIPGMGGVNSFFFAHQEPETSDDQMSKLNQAEAEMVCHFFVYLFKNGIPPSNITVLTCYTGQRTLLRKKLREDPDLRGHHLHVETVDSYQGEENVVILLSMVRSNSRNQIGFLASENRACVALSRAQRGFYIFGDARALCKSSMLWWYVVQCMAQEPCRVGSYLPLTCTNHKHITFLHGELAILRLS